MKREVEDWLTELPPLDGDGDDVAVDVDTADDIEPAIEHGSLDDASADNLDIADEATDLDDAAAEEGDETWSADVGEPELDLPADEADDAAFDDENRVDATLTGELDLDDEHELAADDGGDEGTREPIELDEQLPALDADDEGDFEDVLIADALGGLAADAPYAHAALRWSDAAWEERPARSRPLGWCGGDDPLIDVCSHGVTVVIGATAAGQLWVADNERVTGVLLAALPATAGVPLERPLAVAMQPGARTLWVIDRRGRLLRSIDRGVTWGERGRAEPMPLAAAGREGALALLLADGNGARIVSSEDGVSWFAQRVAVALQLAGERTRTWMAFSAGAIAIGDAGGVWLARDGRSFARVAATEGATAGTFIGQRADAPLVLARPAPDDDGGTHLLRVNELGEVEIIAHLAPRLPTDPDDDDLVALHLDWEVEQQTLYVAFASAIVACSPPLAVPARRP